MEERHRTRRRELLADDARKIFHRKRHVGRQQKGVRKLGSTGIPLDAQRVVHVREALLLGNQRDVKAARVPREFAQLRRRNAVERRRQRIRRADEHVLHVRRVTVHF